MERLNWHIADELSRHAQVQVIGPQGSAALRPAAVPVVEVPLRPLPRFLLASAWQAVTVARRFKPHIVLAGSGLTAPAAWLVARASGARAHVYLHGLDAAVQHPVYRALWHPAIRHMDGVIANSQPTAELARGLGVAADKIRIIHPGVTLPETPQSVAALQAFRARHNLGSARLLLSVGRLTTRKGLREFVQRALPAIVQAAPDTVLVVVGEAPADSLHASVQTRPSIQAVADAAGIGQHLRFLGVITDEQELACAYESAALHIFPVRHLPGDPEGFGMVAVEATAHGLPTIAFATGGIVDAVGEGVSGHLVAPGDYGALASAAVTLLGEGTAVWQAGCRSFAAQFAWPLLGEKMRNELMS
ncbi:glycosyltransferase family 4 protein [Comamonas badia]|uniref:glycosyltransferase family 4 protein n=1 Tax=Comamonas badia TaxID=265291 RepID=UPI001B7F9FEE|nr:glycosyltransferase [Comamonas badia]